MKESTCEDCGQTYRHTYTQVRHLRCPVCKYRRQEQRKRSQSPEKYITCQECGASVEKKGGAQKYCTPCAQDVQRRRVAESNRRAIAARKDKRNVIKATPKCWQCGEQQICNRGPRWFCSDECRERYERFERHCEENGGWLSPQANHGLTRLGVELRVAEAEAREDAADAEWAALHYGARG